MNLHAFSPFVARRVRRFSRSTHVCVRDACDGRSITRGRPSLGFSLYGIKTLPLMWALKTCAEIGYSHVEFALNAGYVTEPTTFSAADRRTAAMQLRELKLELPCLMVLMSLTADDKAHVANLKLIAAAVRWGVI